MSTAVKFFLIVVVSAQISFAQAQSNPARDNYIALDVYDTIFSMKRGERIRIRALYEDDNTRQKKAVLNEFGSNVTKFVTREQVYYFVRKQFELHAIAELGGIDGRELSPAEQDRFTLRHRAILRTVTKAVYEARFVPYPRDYEMVGKSFDILNNKAP